MEADYPGELTPDFTYVLQTLNMTNRQTAAGSLKARHSRGKGTDSVWLDLRNIC